MVAAYARFLARYPLIILICTLLVCVGCLVILGLTTEVPDFSNPIKGFETRGTEISQRSLALRNLRIDLDNFRKQNNVFYRYPDEYAVARNLSEKSKWQRDDPHDTGETGTRVQTGRALERRATRSDNESALDPPSKPRKKEKRKGKKLKVQEADPRKPLGYCNTTPSQSSRGEDYAMIAFEVDELFSPATFTSLCDAEQKLWAASVADFITVESGSTVDPSTSMGAFMTHDSCQVTPNRRCCQPWHLASVTAYLLDKPDCSHLNDSDVAWMKSRVDYCRRFSKTAARCWTSGEADCLKTVPVNCSTQPMYLLYQYLLPKDYSSKQQQPSKPNVTLIILPIPTDAYAELSLNQIERLPAFVSTDHLRLIAMDLGVRDTVFEQYLLKDAVFGGLAVVLVFVSIWIYSGSFLFSLAVMISIVLSLVLAFFVYRSVFGIEFFPFMNLLTFVLIIGVGADDAFIFRSAWVKAKFDKNSGTHAKILSDTLAHAAVSMLVTSLTTAAAFYTNIASQIIAVKCFGIFAGTAILTHYALVVTWLPACVVLSEKRPIFSTSYCWCCPRWCIRQHRRHLHDHPETASRSASGGNGGERRWSSSFGIDPNAATATAMSGSTLGINSIGVHHQNHRSHHAEDEEADGGGSSGGGGGCRRAGWNTKRFWTVLVSPAQRRYQQLAVLGRVFFQKLLPWLVIKLRYVWLVVFGIVAILAAVAVFYKPGLKLPSKDYFQYFKSTHPFERWEDGVKQRFAFGADGGRMPMIMHVMWGVQPTADARTFDPDHTGTLKSSPVHHDLFDNVNLLWLRDFCTSLALQNFTRFPSDIPMLASCFVDTFMTVMRQRPCKNPGTGASQWPCCSDVQFPYPPGVFETCLGEYMKIERPTITLFDMMSKLGPSGPLFSVETGQPSALVIVFASRFNFTFSYSEMHEFYETTNSWVTERLRAGPAAVRDGYFVADHLQLYDLQRALSSGTRLSVVIAVAIAFGVLFVTTWNPLISLLAIVSISSVIVTTIAVLILLDWELNVLESTIIILTIGLSFDFTLHYGVAYTLCSTADDRESRVVHALGEVGSPVFMAFATTFLAGAAMLPSTTLAYFQIGLFMILETSISWLYATFFFTSLLHCFGPSGGSCQWNPRNIRCTTRQRSGSSGGGGGGSGGSIGGGGLMGGLASGRRVSRDIATDAALGAAARRKKSSIVSFNAVAFNAVHGSPMPTAAITAAKKLSTMSTPDYARLETRRPIAAAYKVADRFPIYERNHHRGEEQQQESAIVEAEPMIKSASVDAADIHPIHSTPLSSPQKADSIKDDGHPTRSTVDDENRDPLASAAAPIDLDEEDEYVPTDSDVIVACPIADEPIKRRKKPSLKERAASVFHKFSIKRQQPTIEQAPTPAVELDEEQTTLCRKLSSEDDDQQQRAIGGDQSANRHQDVPYIDGDTSMQSISAAQHAEPNSDLRPDLV